MRMQSDPKCSAPADYRRHSRNSTRGTLAFSALPMVHGREQSSDGLAQQSLTVLLHARDVCAVMEFGLHRRTLWFALR